MSKIYMIQGPGGPVQAKRPTDDQLAAFADKPYIERLSAAIELAKQGLMIDQRVDVAGADYWKVMEGRRLHGFSWVPSASMPNLQTTPGNWMPSNLSDDGISYDGVNPPLGAILVPKSEQDDPNYAPPMPVQPPAPPPDGVAVFGPPVMAGEFAGAFRVGNDNTVPPGSHATKDGVEYVYIVLGKIGTLFYLKLWIPTGG